MDFILDVYVGWCLFFCFSLEIGCTGMKSEILSIKIKCIKNREKEKWKMKDKIFGVLQRIGRSFMLPIAILPVAGLLLGIGSSFTNATSKDIGRRYSAPCTSYDHEQGRKCGVR